MKSFNFNQLKKLILKLISNYGYSIHKKTDSSQPNSMLSSLIRLKNVGIGPQTILDLGAAKGLWTIKAQSLWPEANYLLFEPIKEQVSLARSNTAHHPKVTIVNAVASNKTGMVNFNVSDDLDGSGVYDNSTNSVQLPSVQLDQYYDSLKGPILIKFDTHGYEVPILEGAVETLKNTEAIIMEVYGFDVSPTALKFPDMCKHLEKLSFRLWDIVDIMRRPGDNAFWQADAVFLKDSNLVFKSNKYN